MRARDMLNRLYSLVVKELLQFSRDRLLLLAILIGPALQLWLVGGGSGTSVTGIPAAVIDRDLSPVSRELIAALDNTQELTVKFYPEALEAAQELIDDGRANVIVLIPEGFSADVLSGERAEVQLIIDGTNVAAAADAQTAAQGAIETLGWNIVLASAGSGVAPRGIDLRQEALYNQALDNRLYEVTAHLAFFTFIVVTLTAVMGIVKEFEIGTMEQIMVTPFGQVELILGKAIAPSILGLINFTVMAIMARLIFDLPMRGSWILLGLLTLLYLISEVCVALMISTISRTQQQAITTVFIWIMVALTMSGFLVPIASLPTVLRWVASALPIQHFIGIVRSVMLKGAGLSALWEHVVALVVLDLVVVTITAFLLRRLGK